MAAMQRLLSLAGKNWRGSKRRLTESGSRTDRLPTDSPSAILLKNYLDGHLRSIWGCNPLPEGTIVDPRAIVKAGFSTVTLELLRSEFFNRIRPVQPFAARHMIGSNAGVLRSTSFDKYAVAFFRISHSIRSRAFSARKRDSSICSGVTTLAPAGFSSPRSVALTQLRSVCYTNPSSRATGPTPCPAFTRLTFSSLNSAVYSCFGILNITFLPLCHPICSILEDEFSGEAKFLERDNSI